MEKIARLEVKTSIFIAIEEGNKFKLYTDNFGEFSSAEIKDKLEKVLSISDITPSDLQHEMIGPRIIQA